MSYLNLLFYIISVIQYFIKLYFLTIYLLVSEFMNIIFILVSEYFKTFSKLFIHCTEYPQIMWFTIIIGLSYLFILLFFRNILLTH